MNGTVKWFDDARGFGFITPDGDDDVFVHFSGIERGAPGDRRTLTTGDAVVFDTRQGRKGVEACNVRRS